MDLFFIRKRINLKVREDLSKRNSNAEIFSVEIENKNSKNLIISGIYKAPCADFKLFETDFKEILSKVSPSNKSLFLASDINKYSIFLFETAQQALLTDPQEFLKQVRHASSRS